MADRNEAHSRHELGEPAVLEGRHDGPDDDPEPEADDEGDRYSENSPGERACDDAYDGRPGVDDRVAQVAPESVADVLKVLLPQRPARLNAVNCLYLRQYLVRGLPSLLGHLGHQVLHGIPRHQADHEERQTNDDVNREEGHRQPFCEVGSQPLHHLWLEPRAALRPCPVKQMRELSIPPSRLAPRSQLQLRLKLQP